VDRIEKTPNGTLKLQKMVNAPQFVLDVDSPKKKNYHLMALNVSLTRNDKQ